MPIAWQRPLAEAGLSGHYADQALRRLGDQLLERRVAGRQAADVAFVP
jgi:hypothetical protein